MAASDKELGELHKVVATTLTELCEIRGEGEERVPPPAAYLGAAIAFLKNNNITADPTKNDALAALGDALKRRATRRGVDADLVAASEAFSRSLGEGFTQ